MAQAINIPNSISASDSTPTPPVENDPFEVKVTNDHVMLNYCKKHANIQNITRQVVNVVFGHNYT